MDDGTHETHCDAPEGHAWNVCVSAVHDFHGVAVWRTGDKVSIGGAELDHGQWVDFTQSVELLFGVVAAVPATVP